LGIVSKTFVMKLFSRNVGECAEWDYKINA